MTKRLILQLIFCCILSIANASIDLLPLSKIYLKAYICEYKIDDLLKHKSLAKIASTLTKMELVEIKESFCKSTILLKN